MYNYEGNYGLDEPSWSRWRARKRTPPPSPEGVTALHAASVSHNAVVKELREPKNLCRSSNTELEERRRTYAATVKILLLMGASVGTKVSAACPSRRAGRAVTANASVGLKKRTHVPSRGCGGGQRGAAAALPRLFVWRGGH